jgi:hypothetical protein
MAASSRQEKNNFLLVHIFCLRTAGSLGTFGLLIVGFGRASLYVGLLLPKEWRRF